MQHSRADCNLGGELDQVLALLFSKAWPWLVEGCLSVKSMVFGVELPQLFQSQLLCQVTLSLCSSVFPSHSGDNNTSIGSWSEGLIGDYLFSAHQKTWPVKCPATFSGYLVFALAASSSCKVLSQDILLACSLTSFGHLQQWHFSVIPYLATKLKIAILFTSWHLYPLFLLYVSSYIFSLFVCYCMSFSIRV